MKILRKANQGATQVTQGTTPSLLDTAAKQLFGVTDPVNGGIRGAPKFPQAGLLELFWRAGLKTHDKRYHDLVIKTLMQICSGGIYDHLGGGFARYAVDEEWLVPHFENMLYDNAQLIVLLSEAFVESGQDLFRVRIEETIAWLEREITTEGGGFAASLDADSEHEEGRFYVWYASDIEKILSPDDYTLFTQTYDLMPSGNWEGKTILNWLCSAPYSNPEEEERLTRIRQILLKERDKRVRPALDDKILADWKGLMIAARVRASEVLARPEWLFLAECAFHFISESMTGSGRLGHSWRSRRLSFPGLASYYANAILAALALYRGTANPNYI
ncbi:MAG: hypothetical protein QNJ43_05740 [Breoghania sp.]|nr:hypothetical protein [Breoghania sp.]